MNASSSSPSLSLLGASDNAKRSEQQPAPQFIRINGRKVIGPPANWVGPPPSIRSEVFVKHIPKDMPQLELLQIFQAFGPIYNIRLMVDFGDQNRGFGYVHFAQESDADKCIAILRHRFLKPHRKLYLMKSYDKSRFFVSRLPTDRSESDIRQALRQVFPEMSKVSFYGPTVREERGFAFVDFPSHAAAIRAKKGTSTGRCRLFDRDVKVVWANPEPNVPHEDTQNLRKLFVRNIAASVQKRTLYEVLVPAVVQRQDIHRLERVRDLAFMDFFERDAAERVKAALDGLQLENQTLEVFWGIPHKKRSAKETSIDHDTTLRMMCVANHWHPPIYIFGQVFTQVGVQFVSVIMEPRAKTQRGCIITMQIRVRCADLQSRVAEVAATIIEMHGQLPAIHYMLLVDEHFMHIVGRFTDLQTAAFEKAHPISDDRLAVYTMEMYEMCHYIHMLLQSTHDRIQYDYVTAISKTTDLAYMPMPSSSSSQLNRCFGCIHPFLFRRPPLAYGLQCDPMLLALCFTRTGRNVLEGSNGAAPMRLVDVVASSRNAHGLVYRRVTMSDVSGNLLLNDGAIYFPRALDPIGPVVATGGIIPSTHVGKNAM